MTPNKGYQGFRFRRFIRSQFGAAAEIGENHTSPARGFVPAETGWVVERAFAWLSNARRLSVDRERLPKNSATMIRIVFIQLLLRHVAAEICCVATGNTTYSIHGLVKRYMLKALPAGW